MDTCVHFILIYPKHEYMFEVSKFFVVFGFENPSINKDFMAFKNFGKFCKNHFSTMPPFTVEERKWIILKFGEVKLHTLVKRAFQKQFFPKQTLELYQM